MSTMRIGGLASGLDTSEIISQLMSAERMPLDRLIKNKTLLEWQRDKYREVNLEISKLRDSFVAAGLGLQSTFLQKKVTSSNDKVVTATASANASNTSVQMKVNQLATPANFVSNEITDQNILSKKLSEWDSGFQFDENGKATLMFEVQKPGGAYEAVAVELNESDTLQTAMNKLNKAGVGFSAFLDKSADGSAERLVLTMTDTGAGAGIRMGSAIAEDTDAEKAAKENALAFFSSLGFNTVDNGDTTDLVTSTAGQNAIVEINGHVTQRTSNSFTINGVTYSLNGISEPGEVVMITSQTDTEKIMESIMNFVEQYNNLIDLLNGVLREDKHRDYKPLTDDEKAAMSEREIELWEAKAKSGLLRNDSTLMSAMYQMRSAMFSGVAGGFIKDLSEIGLVSSSNYNDGGKIVFDTNRRTMPNGESMTGEDRLRYYIENHGEELYNFFMNDSEEASERGVLRKLRSTLDYTVNQVTERAGREGRTNQQFTLGRQLNDIEDRITNFERRLQQKETRYWAQFTALEKAMAQMNSQAEQLYSMLYSN
ncbi:flagellar hook-associated protein 2 [Evansella caseinilytica]|uniref:Flagellar hook-associated protein 2 n=1 Tax=Evansella caseinilytica TaxID=1503961 RepID=A0A1H3S6Q0_9BACI|nr:flagellar hook-associated protein 2 [Evansella caseinilytica]SDZ33793.1 flagellar hook-associated protein 2 [Evansella caseinilytica]